MELTGQIMRNLSRLIALILMVSAPAHAEPAKIAVFDFELVDTSSAQRATCCETGCSRPTMVHRNEVADRPLRGQPRSKPTKMIGHEGGDKVIAVRGTDSAAGAMGIWRRRECWGSWADAGDRIALARILGVRAGANERSARCSTGFAVRSRANLADRRKRVCFRARTGESGALRCGAGSAMTAS